MMIIMTRDATPSLADLSFTSCTDSVFRDQTRYAPANERCYFVTTSIIIARCIPRLISGPEVFIVLNYLNRHSLPMRKVWVILNEFKVCSHCCLYNCRMMFFRFRPMVTCKMPLYGVWLFVVKQTSITSRFLSHSDAVICVVEGAWWWLPAVIEPPPITEDTCALSWDIYTSFLSNFKLITQYGIADLCHHWLR